VALHDFITNNVINYKHKSKYNLHYLSYTRKIFNLKCDWENHIFTGSDLNFIHPDVVKKLGIKTQKIDKPFRVSGLGYGIPNVSKETEKCICQVGGLD